MKTTLTIKGIHCKSCEMLIKDALEDIGVTDSTFNKDKLTIDSDISLEKIKKAIRSEGYQVE
jgi:copper chaperone CopZ